MSSPHRVLDQVSFAVLNQGASLSRSWYCNSRNLLNLMSEPKGGLKQDPLTDCAGASEWSLSPQREYTATPAEHAQHNKTTNKNWRPRRTFSRTSAPKFLSAATFTHTHPSFSPAVGTLYVALGTADTTTSESARQRARSNSGGAWRTTWCGWNARRALSPVLADAAGRLVYSWIESMSTEKTRAPSFARSAARGRPTTSDLWCTCVCVYVCGGAQCGGEGDEGRTCL